MKDAENYLRDVFSIACGNIYEAREKRAEIGAERFVKKGMGLLRRIIGGTLSMEVSTTKTLDEISELLVNTQIASSLEEARALAPEIIKASRLSTRYIVFREIANGRGKVKYSIFVPGDPFAD